MGHVKPHAVLVAGIGPLQPNSSTENSAYLLRLPDV